MELPFLVAGMLLRTCLSPLRDPMIRFLSKQIDILLRILADHGVTRVICTPAERRAILAIGADLDHKVKPIFRINTWGTYRAWLRDAEKGKEPGRPGRQPKFTEETIALVVSIARENIVSGLGKIVGGLKKLGVEIPMGTVKAILRKHNTTPPDGRQHSVTGNWQKLVSNVDSLVVCDFLTKKVYSLRGSFDAYVLVFIHLSTRRVWMSPVTRSPHDEWCRCQAIQACMWTEVKASPSATSSATMMPSSRIGSIRFQ